MEASTLGEGLAKHQKSTSWRKQSCQLAGPSDQTMKNGGSSFPDRQFHMSKADRARCAPRPPLSQHDHLERARRGLARSHSKERVRGGRGRTGSRWPRSPAFLLLRTATSLHTR